MTPTEFAHRKFQFLAALFRDERLSRGELAIAGLLLEHYNSQTGKCFPSQCVLADESGLSEYGVYNALRGLREKGWITVTTENITPRGTRNYYQFQGDGYSATMARAEARIGSSKIKKKTDHQPVHGQGGKSHHPVHRQCTNLSADRPNNRRNNRSYDKSSLRSDLSAADKKNDQAKKDRKLKASIPLKRQLQIAERQEESRRYAQSVIKIALRQAATISVPKYRKAAVSFITKYAAYNPALAELAIQNWKGAHWEAAIVIEIEQPDQSVAIVREANGLATPSRFKRLPPHAAAVVDPLCRARWSH